MDKTISPAPLATPDGRFGFIIGCAVGAVAAMMIVFQKDLRD
jgi:hypothetical protein